MYKCKHMTVTVHGGTVGVVEGLSIELIKEGSIEFVYGSDTGHHGKGPRHATFTIRRWFMVDTDKDLLYWLFENDIPFALTGAIIGLSGSTIGLSDCEGYRWRPVTGAAGDTVAEELVGEAVCWTNTDLSAT